MKEQHFCIDCGRKIHRQTWFYGSKKCKSCCRKGELNACYGIKRLDAQSRIGDKNPNWKGSEVGYSGLHAWISRHKPKPKLCEQCNKKPPSDLANKSGEYRRDINDFEWLCRDCHMTKDGRINNLKQYSKRMEVLV